jgi:L-fuconolactonase
LAEFQNIYRKLGGLGMTHFYNFSWNKLSVPPGSMDLANAMSPYYNYCIENFGTGRCMFESNWPVDKES